MRPTATLARNPNGLYDLTIKGQFFHPHWVAHLSAGLAGQGVSIMSGRAAEEDDLEWSAQFTLDFQGSAAAPEAVDYVGLAAKTLPADLAKVSLTRFRLSRRTDQQLELVLEGPDQIGFLGRILMRLSLLAQFPSEMDINTVAGQIKDRIILHGIGGKGPAEVAKNSLDGMLKQLVTGK
jgi:hypothetical protein